ncbi:hypothetical protein D3C71_1844230 [compost metagenome]
MAAAVAEDRRGAAQCAALEGGGIVGQHYRRAAVLLGRGLHQCLETLVLFRGSEDRAADAAAGKMAVDDRHHGVFRVVEVVQEDFHVARGDAAQGLNSGLEDSEGELAFFGGGERHAGIVKFNCLCIFTQ